MYLGSSVDTNNDVEIYISIWSVVDAATGAEIWAIIRNAVDAKIDTIVGVAIEVCI